MKAKKNIAITYLRLATSVVDGGLFESLFGDCFIKEVDMQKFKDFLVTENQRNHDGHKTFERFLRAALAREDVVVLVAHHIVYELPDEEPIEIPSADTLCFSPELMTAVFGDKAMAIMLTLAHRTPDLRDKVLADFLDERDLQLKDEAKAA